MRYRPSGQSRRAGGRAPRHSGQKTVMLVRFKKWARLPLGLGKLVP